MTTIVGVRFRGSGKIYYFNPNGLDIRPGANVIVETARGIEYGTVAGGVREVHDESIPQPLKNVVRIATEEDVAHAAANRAKEREAVAVCKEKIRKHELEMKLIDAECAFDNSKILFYFTADGRIDFRELVKDLASVFRTRIELRQIGVRDETKLLGGIGICGRPLCCSTWLTDFVPVSIRMAKEQNLSLNPTKISGTCGRLMCCLKNEQATYEYLNSQLPAIGERVTTITGLEGEVASVSVLRQKVRVVVNEGDEKEIQEYDVADLQFTPRQKKEKRGEKRDRGGEKRDRGEKREAGEKRGGNERREGSEKREGNERREGGEKREGSEQREGGEKREGTERPGGSDRSERRENSEKREGGPKREGRERREGRDRREGGEKREGNERREGGEKREGSERRERFENRENGRKRERAERRERSEKGEQRAARPERSEKNAQRIEKPEMNKDAYMPNGDTDGMNTAVETTNNADET